MTSGTSRAKSARVERDAGALARVQQQCEPAPCDVQTAKKPTIDLLPVRSADDPDLGSGGGPRERLLDDRERLPAIPREHRPKSRLGPPQHVLRRIVPEVARACLLFGNQPRETARAG